ncbi:MAG: competence/damage-inducible protein A [Phycisphaerales bacterium]
MNAATLSIGDEIVLGQIDDTNARTIAERLAELGVFRGEHRAVGDDVDAIADALAALAQSHDVVVVTGGLGPTKDDLTRDALNRVVDPGAELVEDEQARVALDRWFKGRGRAMPASNLVQALRPRSARCLENPNGTAPGLFAESRGAMIWCLPGPPREMVPMLERETLGMLAERAGDEAMPTLAVHSYGAGESALAERLGDLMRRDADPVIGTTASRSIVSARIRSRGDRATALARVAAAAREVERLWAPYAYGRGETTLADACVGLLRARRESLAVAESCTGGLLGAMVTDVAGSSEAFAGGWIVYSNDLKERSLQVSRSTLAAHGAVSAAVAHELALAARTHARSTWGIGITGIAGPGGGSAAKPVGTVFIGLAGPAEVTVRRFQFPGERVTVRDRAAKSALQWLRCAMLDQADVSLLWGFAEPPRSEGP